MEARASLDGLTQFPHEREALFPVLSHIRREIEKERERKRERLRLSVPARAGGALPRPVSHPERD
jgi:hypothetical protein